MSTKMPSDPKLLQRLQDLDHELEDGEITQKGYEKRKGVIMALHEKKTKKYGPKLYAPPLFKAAVSETADAAMTVRSSTADIDDAVLATIKKCLDRANHPETPEGEAKVALYLATRRMKQYNVSQAEVLAHESPEERRNYSGHSTVEITRRDGDLSKEVFQHVYLNALMDAMDRFFDVKSLTTGYHSRTQFDVTFYGLADNSAAAALAFEMVYNLIGEWARKFKGLPSKNSYCMGVCNELRLIAIKEKEEEEARAVKAEKEALKARLKEEKAQRQAELDRLAEQPVKDGSTGEAIQDTGDEVKSAHPANRDGRYNATVEDEDEDGDENMVGRPHLPGQYNATVENVDEDMADDGDEWNGFSDGEADTDADQRIILFRKMMKRVAGSVFEDDVARCNTLVAAINEELEVHPELGEPFTCEEESNRLLERLVFLDVFEENFAKHHVKLTPWMRRELFGDPSDSGIDTDMPMSGNGPDGSGESNLYGQQGSSDATNAFNDTLQSISDDEGENNGNEEKDYNDEDYIDADFHNDSEPPPPEVNLQNLFSGINNVFNDFRKKFSTSGASKDYPIEVDAPVAQPHPRSPEPADPAQEDTGHEPEWSSRTQLIAFRDTAKKIAEEYCEKTWGKLRKGRFREMKTVDHDALVAGTGDAHKIDVHRKTITG